MADEGFEDTRLYIFAALSVPVLILLLAIYTHSVSRDDYSYFSHFPGSSLYRSSHSSTPSHSSRTAPSPLSFQLLIQRSSTCFSCVHVCGYSCLYNIHNPQISEAKRKSLTPARKRFRYVITKSLHHVL